MAETQQKKTKTKLVGNDRRNMWLLIVTTFLVVVAVAIFTPLSQRINQGLDIQGGLSVVLSAKSDDGSNPSTEQMEKSRSIIENRVNALGASEAVVQLQSDNQILVQIPGLSDTETALATIGKTGKLEFARLDSFTDKEVVRKIQNGEYGSTSYVTDEMGNYFEVQGSENRLKVKPGTYTPLITGDNIFNVTIGKESEASANYAVNLDLDSVGTKAFAEATKDLVKDHGLIVIILDGEVQSAPAVQSEIVTGDVSITGKYTMDGAKALQTVLESGSLPVSFHYEQSQVVGPTLGQDALHSGVIVACIGLLIVLLYLLIFYKGLGIIAALAMVVFAVLYLGILAFLSHFGLFSLSLSGIAGIVLTIGMAADSSVLTLERFREEIRMGRSIRAASISGVRHAIQTSIDADLVSLVSALCLFFLAAASVKGFGLTLALGILCDIAMMLLFKAPLVRLLAPRAIRRNPGFWDVQDSIDAARSIGAIAPEDADMVSRIDAVTAEDGEESEVVGAPIKPKDLKGRFIKRDINFMGVRKILLSIAAVCIVLSFGVFAIRGVNLGIEFVGGTSVTFHDTGDVTIEQVRDAFDKAGEPDAVIQTTNSDGEEGFLVRTTTTSAEDAAATANEVGAQFGWTTSDFEVTTIGPDWGSSVVKASLIAFLVSLLLIIIYIGIRFRDPKMGVIAIVALLHDLIIVLGVYALVGRELNPNTIAALLTILGYSLYDTVVVFHRITDNMKQDGIKCTFMTMANHSVNQVFMRTINTTLTSLIPVIAMLFFGGETLKDFAFAMVIGLICGSYSSIGIATPLYAMWKAREPRFAKLRERYGDEVGIFEFGQTETTYAPVASKKELAAAAASGVDIVAIANEQSAAAAQKAAKKAADAAKKGSGSLKSQSAAPVKYSKKPWKQQDKK